MNKLLILFFTQLIYFNTSFAVLGCMDNSYHLALPCDFKKYNYVRCECPCRDIIDSRGTCRRCGHFGNPFRGELNSLQELCYIYR